MKANKTMEGQAVLNLRRRKDKESESNIDSAAHNQTLKQQKQLNDRNPHNLSIITLNVNGLNSPIKRHRLETALKRTIQQSIVYRRLILLIETSTGLG
jgi:hypothetical protein